MIPAKRTFEPADPYSRCFSDVVCAACSVAVAS